MLEVISIQNPKQKREFFLKTFQKSEDIQNITWVVSDLMSKISLQKELFKKKDIVPDEALLRVHELWKMFFQRMHGEYQIVSEDTARIILQKYLATKSEDWMLRPGVAQMAMQYMQSLMPILHQPHHYEIMEDFFKKDPKTFQKWGHWYFLCQDIDQYFHDKKLILSSWIASQLLDEKETSYSRIWKRKIIFDLGAQLQPLEAELITQLSRELDIIILSPEPLFLKEYPQLLKKYESFNKNKNEINKEAALTKPQIFYKKYSTNLAEIQDLCVQIRNWVTKDHIALEKIAVAAPDIGVYWPVLVEYLKVEGIPFQRSITAPLKSFPEILTWLSRLKIETGLVQYSDLEQSLYSSEAPPQKYDEFESQYKNVYGLQDLKDLKKYYRLQFDETNLTLHDFFEWSKKFWKENWSQERIKILASKIYAEVPGHVLLKRSEWIQFVESFATRDIQLEDGFANGIHCIDLISLKDTDADHVIVLGLADKALRKTGSILISEKDISRLRQDYGLYISDLENIELEFELRWNMESSIQKLILSYPQTDFDGQRTSPSIVWFRGAYEQNRFDENIPLEIPQKARWFQIQKKNEADMGDEEEAYKPWSLEKKDLQISASQIEDYLNCPFIWASKKLFRLSDLPELDLDIDYQTRGKLLHKVAELLYKKHPSFIVTEEQLDSLFEEAQREGDFQIFDLQIWVAQKNRYKKMIREFIDFELHWRSQYPLMLTKYPETDFTIYLDSQTCQFQKSPYPGAVLFRGRIDRIDVNEEHNACVVIDYKYSLSGKGNHGVWTRDNELQLALYAMAIEHGAIQHSYKVVGAIYFGFKEMNRNKGFLEEEYRDLFYPITDKSRAKINEQGKQKLYQSVQEKTLGVIQNIQANEFNPKPYDIEICQSCHWRNVCRAPHLR